MRIVLTIINTSFQPVDPLNLFKRISDRSSMITDPEALLQFYARRDVQDAMVALAKDREVAVKYGDGGFGKRPDMIQYPSDVLEFARNGATSFHVSEERWRNPLEIVTGMPKKELDGLRIGWDCVLDIDSPYVEYSQITTYLLVEALKFYGITSVGVKFSGRKGFHILVPFESFPEEVGGIPIEIMFPEGPRMIAAFLEDMIADKLRDSILSGQSLQEIIKATGKPEKELITVDGKFNPFAVVDIDTILISSRHLFRSVYSVNEKSGLMSIPVDPNAVQTFKLGSAKIDKVTTDIPFMRKAEPGEARSLVMQSFDFSKRPGQEKKRSTIIMKGKDVFALDAAQQKHDFSQEAINYVEIKEEYYPSCIQQLLKGVQTDGRKRAVFVLMNFFNALQYPYEIIDAKLQEWNAKNYEPLREGYLRGQLQSIKRSKTRMLPPNCSNKAYYKDLGVACVGLHCDKVKNPLNFTLGKLRWEKQKKKTKKKVVKKTVKKASKKQAA